ncbi:hypothetical protein EG829_30805, partial [bacterium]|nr:hypothetical protein [bacterium]
MEAVAMDPKELLKAGQLKAARQQLAEHVKANPADTARRTLLFQSLLFCGEWDKAERHLDMLVAQDSRSETGVQVYKNLIAAERERLEVVSGSRRPAFMTPVPPFLDAFFIARQKLLEGKIDDAARVYGEIEEQLPMVSGTLDGAPFKGMKDLDACIPWFLEVFIHERYLWIPFSSLRELSLTTPKTLLETLWTPARIVTMEGLATSCFVPALYPGTASSDDDLVRLGKMTVWEELGDGFYGGRGQHLL